MSQKKHKKRTHSSTVAAKRQAEHEKLADEMDRAKNRMDPTARLLLWGDLVFLALFSLLDLNGLLSPVISGGATVIGLILLFVALYLQFVKKKDDGGPINGPRLK